MVRLEKYCWKRQGEVWLYAVVILGPRLRVTLPSLKLGFQENTGQGSWGGAFPSQSARKGEQAWRSLFRRIVWAKARDGAHHLCSCSAGENRIICHLPPLNYKESWDTGSARMFTERGKAFGGQPATTEPFLRSRLLVKWEGAWGPEHSDCSKDEDVFAESRPSFHATKSKRGKQWSH